MIFDCLALASILGIWPRFIEPRLLKTTTLSWELENSQHHLAGLTIAHLSDLHFHKKVPQKFLDKISKRVAKQKPDLLLFTGDFLCYSSIEDQERLTSFLSTLEAPLGSFCSFGNHDYAAYVSLSKEGIYDLIPRPNPLAGICLGIKALLFPQKSGTQASERARSTPLHAPFCALLANTPFKILENRTATLPIGLNLTGLGDLALGRCQPEVAFTGYDLNLPGIILSHNPDTFPSLLNCPGDWILCGHTHGEQIHIPWPKWGRALSRKLARLENSAYTRGLFQVGNKKMYVNRGLGCHKPFRLLSPPELCIIKAVKR